MNAMSQTEQQEQPDQEPEVNGESVIGQKKEQLMKFYHSLLNRKPVYRLTETGMQVEYYSFSDTSELPFDVNTYQNSQLFLGDYANPWNVEVEQILEEYPEADGNISEKELVENDYIIPSQKYKAYMKQKVYSDMFSESVLGDLPVMRILYIMSAGIGFIILLLVGAVL